MGSKSLKSPPPQEETKKLVVIRRVTGRQVVARCVAVAFNGTFCGSKVVMLQSMSSVANLASNQKPTGSWAVLTTTLNSSPCLLTCLD
eukprot:1053271-Pelagomonas_calceolata.AAC.1